MTDTKNPTPHGKRAAVKAPWYANVPGLKIFVPPEARQEVVNGEDGPATALSALVQGCKGGLSYLVNQARILPAPLRWQRGFWAESVSASSLPRLVAYLQRQRLHHAQGTALPSLEPLTPD